MPKKHEHPTGLNVDLDFEGQKATVYTDTKCVELLMTRRQLFDIGGWFIQLASQLFDYEQAKIPEGKTYHVTPEGPRTS